MERLQIEHFKDWEVEVGLDAQLRKLLSVCFTKPRDAIFQTQRFFVEPPPYRWIIRHDDSSLAAHAACHLKALKCGDAIFWCGAIAEVCVHPDFRGRGYVRALLADVHKWLKKSEIPFGVLFGNPLVYSSSGYRLVLNLWSDGGAPEHEPKDRTAFAMTKSLTAKPWPEEKVVLLGEDHF